MKTFLMLALVLLGASAAQAQEKGVAITGSPITLGSLSEEIDGKTDDSTPWGIGVTVGGEQTGSKTRLMIEGFSTREFLSNGRDYAYRSAVARSYHLAVRGEKSWGIPLPAKIAKLKILPSIGVFGGLAFITGEKFSSEEAGFTYCPNGEDFCLNFPLPLGAVDDIELEPIKGASRTYMGVVVAGSRQVAKNTMVEVAWDAKSNQGRKVRFNVSWRPDWRFWRKK